MSYHDAIMDVLRRDPGREYRTAEIIAAIFPEAAEDRRSMDKGRCAIGPALRSAERYGFIQRRTPVPHQGDYWRLAE